MKKDLNILKKLKVKELMSLIYKLIKSKKDYNK